MVAAIVALLVSGLLQPIMSPPLNWIVFHPIAWVPAFAVFSRLEGRRAFLAGWLAATAANLGIFHWLPGTMRRFGGLPDAVSLLLWVLFALGISLYLGVFAWGFARVRRTVGRGWPFAIAAWFCALEFLNPQLFAYYQGVGWYQVPRLFLASSVVGVSGISFLAIACNAIVLQGVERAWKRRPGERADLGAAGHSHRAWLVNVAVLGALVVAAVTISSLRLQRIAAAERDAPALHVALVQPDHTIERREAMERMAPDTFARDMVGLSREAIAREPAGSRIDVFVWPEGALRSDPAQPRHREVLDFVRESGVEVWTGANHFETREKGSYVVHNSAFRIFDGGRIDRRYDKNVLVPFGEYMPLADVIPSLDVVEAVGNFEAGSSVPVYEAGKARFVFLICYEAIRNAFVRRAVADENVNLIVNLTIDAWYGNTSEQSQHLMLAAVQSALHGIPLLRATSTGLSAFVDARGVITAQTGNYAREVLVGDVRPMRVASTYTRTGDWFAWACVAASAMLLVASRRKGSIS